MNGDDERDYEEEAYNRRTMEDEARAEAQYEERIKEAGRRADREFDIRRAADRFRGNPVIALAVDGLRAWGGENMTQTRAEKLLALWQYSDQLVEPERLAILAEFSDDDEEPHLCDESTMEYVATYGAPGYGQAWRCKVCRRDWAKVGNTFYDPAEGMHILDPEDVR